AVVQHQSHGADVVAGVAVLDRPRPGGVGGEHTPQRTGVAAGRVRREAAAELRQPGVDLPQRDARLRPQRSVGDFDDLAEMLAEIHDQSRAQRFAGDSGAGAARDQGQLVLGGVADQALHVLLVARHGHAERLHLEDAGVGAVQRPGEFVEVQLALEEPLEVVGEPAALLIVHEPLCPRSEDPYCYWYANNWKSLAATRSASAAERV